MTKVDDMNSAELQIVISLAGIVIFFPLMIGGYLWISRKDKTYFTHNPLVKFWSIYPFNQINRNDFQLIKVQDIRNDLFLSIQFSDENNKKIAVLNGGIAQPNSRLQIEDKIYKIHFPENKSFSSTTTIYDPDTLAPMWEIVAGFVLRNKITATFKSAARWQLCHFGVGKPFLGVSQNMFWKNEKDEIIALKHAPFKYRATNIHVLAIKSDLTDHEKALIFTTFNA